MLRKLSPSKLNLLEECPRCFWLSIVKKIDRPSGPMASIVIKMDSIIKHYFDRYREKNQLPPIIKGIVKGRLPKNMPKTLNHQVNETIILTGKPDEYLEIDGGLIVPFDHKTKSKSPEENHPAHLLQMDVYCFLLKANGYKTTNKAFLAYYYPDDCDLHNGMDIHCKVMQITTNPSRVNDLLEKAQKVLEGKIPKAGKDCDYCKWHAKADSL